MAEPDGASLRRLAGLSLRLLWRDWRGGELGLLSGALLMAVTSVTGIALFTDRLERALLLESANMLAADRVVGGRAAPPREILREGRARGLRTAETLSFTSMAFSDAGSLLVAAKAVGDGYPLRGELIVGERPFAGGAPAPGGPPPGVAWLETRALSALEIEVGGTVHLGEAALTVGGIVVAEPDRSGAGMVDNLGPRLMLHLDDVPRTGVIQPGSRAFARYLFAGDDRAALDGFEQWFRDNEDWRGEFYMRDIRDESEEVAAALERAENFLLLGSLSAVVLAGVAIALTARRYSERHYDYVAIMKTLGCTAGRVMFIYLSIQTALALGAIALGGALGWLVHEGILLLLRSLVTVDLPPPGPGPFLAGAFTALVCLLAFALPPLLALRETPPLRVLRRDLVQRRFGAGAPYLFGLSGTVLLVYWYSGSLLLTGALLAGVAAVALPLAAVSWLLLRAGGGAGMKAGGAFRLAMAGIRRRRRQNTLQVMVFSVAIMSLLVLTLLRTDLIDEWRDQLPEDAPNHFMMNITSGQIDAMRAFFEENGVAAGAFYPLVSARVTHVNDAPPAPRPDEEEGGGGLVEEAGEDAGPEGGEEGRRVRGGLARRQVTWESELPPDNLVTAGRWWGEDAAPGYVSVEREYADWLGLELGDRLRFEVNRRVVAAEVSSFRNVRWDNMRPNFFIIFSPGTIDRAGATYLSTALLAPEQKELLNELVRRFPTVVVLEVDALIRQIRDIVAQVTSAIELISALVLVCGALVLTACVNASLDERLRENAILRTLGAGRRLILTSLLIEFAAIGLTAGLIATAGAEAMLYYLQREMFGQEFSPHRWAWLAGPALGTAIIAGLGVASTRGVVRTSPLRALRRAA